MDELQPPALLLGRRAGGGVVRAAAELMVSQPTISAQLRELEGALGHRLFDRVGRGLALTPKSLDGAPVLLPTAHSTVRRSLEVWFDSPRAHPTVVADFDDSALMFSFGQDGAGIFPGPAIIESKIRREMGVRLVGRAGTVEERFYAITLEEEPRHPAVVAIRDAARTEIFQEGRTK